MCEKVALLAGGQARLETLNLKCPPVHACTVYFSPLVMLGSPCVVMIK